MQKQQEESKSKSKPAQEEEVALDGPMPIDALTTKGIGGGDIQKMIAAGHNTVQSVLYHPKKNLLNIKGLSENKIDKIIAACQSLVEMGF